MTYKSVNEDSGWEFLIQDVPARVFQVSLEFVIFIYMFDILEDPNLNMKFIYMQIKD